MSFREAWQDARSNQPGFPSRREGLYLLLTLSLASSGIAVDLFWPLPPPHLWQRATTTVLAAAFFVALGLFLDARGVKRPWPWLLPAIGFATGLISLYAIPFK